MMIVAGAVWGHRFEFSAAKVEATAEATTATVAARDYAADQDERLAGRRCHYKVCVHILLAELFRNVESKRAIIVVDIPFGLVAENRMCPVDLFELKSIKKRNQ